MGVFRIRRQLRSYLLSRSLAPCCPHPILLYQLASLLSDEWAFHNEVAWVQAQVTGARSRPHSLPEIWGSQARVLTSPNPEHLPNYAWERKWTTGRRKPNKFQRIPIRYLDEGR